MQPASSRMSGVPAPGTVPSSGQPAAGLSPPGARGAFPPIKGKRSRPAVPWRPRARHFAPFGPSNSRLFPPSASSPCWSVTPNPSRGEQSPGLRQLFEPPQGAGNPQVRHNISRLCNKSGPQAPLVSAPHIIYIMLTCCVSSTYHRFPQFPARARRRQESGPAQGPPGTQSVAGPRTLRIFVGTAVRRHPRSSCRLLRRLRRPQLPLRSPRR